MSDHDILRPRVIRYLDRHDYASIHGLTVVAAGFPLAQLHRTLLELIADGDIEAFRADDRRLLFRKAAR